MKASAPSRLARLGVFGFDAVEPVILAALVTEDPLLLIGPSGTGKTYLLNSLSEALGLEHRHYNASLISFDDLVGFPYPDPDGTGVRFLETPATVWGAESVLIDEISRCKPEHQNRLFSLVHERRVQGIALPRLRWRWAAMNPCSADQSSVQDYAGSEPLDPALADRFALFVTAADWADLTEAERAGCRRPQRRGPHRQRRRRAAQGGRRLARDLRPAPAGAAAAGRRLRRRGHHGAQRRRHPHLAAAGASARAQPARRDHRHRQGEGAALPQRAGLQPAAGLLGRAAGGRGDRRRAPRGVGQRVPRVRGVGPLVPGRGAARPQARPAARQRQDPGRRLAGDRAVPADRVEGARRRLRLRHLPGGGAGPAADRRGGRQRPGQGRLPDAVGGGRGHLERALRRDEHQPSRGRPHRQGAGRPGRARAPSGPTSSSCGA